MDDDFLLGTFFDVDDGDDASMTHSSLTDTTTDRNSTFSSTLFVCFNWKRFITPNTQIQHFSLSSNVTNDLSTLTMSKNETKIDFVTRFSVKKRTEKLFAVLAR